MFKWLITFLWTMELENVRKFIWNSSSPHRWSCANRKSTIAIEPSASLCCVYRRKINWNELQRISKQKVEAEAAEEEINGNVLVLINGFWMSVTLAANFFFCFFPALLHSVPIDPNQKKITFTNFSAKKEYVYKKRQLRTIDLIVSIRCRYYVRPEPKHACRRHINRTNYVCAYGIHSYNSHLQLQLFFFFFLFSFAAFFPPSHTQFVSCIICLYYWICRNCLPACLLTETFVSRFYFRLLFLADVFVFRVNARRVAQTTNVTCDAM